MESLCDLHVHSVFSDGTLTPTQLVQEALRRELSAVALCDHNTVAGLSEFLAAAEGTALEAVPGIEFSCDYRGGEVHVLGLFVEPQYYEKITDLLEDFRKSKEQSNISLVEALEKAGYQLDYPAIKAKTPNGQASRVHIATALMEAGYIASVKEGFKTLLSPQYGYYSPPRRMGAYEAIRFIKSIGAVAVLAHPFLNLTEESLREFLPEAIACGLDGMETMYSKHSEEEMVLAATIADEFGLKHSGGSDFHGVSKPEISMGSGKGNLCIPLKILESLREHK